METDEEKSGVEENNQVRSEKSSAKQRSRARKKKNRREPSKTTALKPQRPFPKVLFRNAIQVPLKIKELNGGNPWPPADVANALEVGSSTGHFYYITAAARDFGLTVGTRDSERIEITSLGRQVVYAPDPETERRSKVEAFFKVEIFRKVFEHYRGAALPETRYLANTLENQFGLHPSLHDEFVKSFTENCSDLGLDQRDVAAQVIPESNGEGTILLAQPRSGGKSRRAFIIMPFGEKNLPDRQYGRPKGFFDEVLRSLLTPAVVSAGFAVETAKRQGSDVIQSTIINELLDADLVIADLTDHNPNVLFELGLRIAAERPVALIKASDTGRIFDVDNMLRVLEYNPNLWPSSLSSDLPSLAEHIKGAWESRANGQTYMKILRRGSSDAAKLAVLLRQGQLAFRLSF
jgi:hypothetical protein